MMMLQAMARATERFESDRESLPFPRGGVFGDEQSGDSDTPEDTVVRPDFANEILRTIDRMQASLDTLERELGFELERELFEIAEIAGRIGSGEPDGWPPAAA